MLSLLLPAPNSPKTLWHAFWNDDTGAILSAEMVIIVTITVLGMITGLSCLQTAIVAELQDVAGAFRSLNQSYAFSGFRGCPKFWGPTSWVSGSRFTDVGNGCFGSGCNMAGAEIAGGQLVVQNAPVTPRSEAVVVPAPTVIPAPACTTCPTELPPAPMTGAPHPPVVVPAPLAAPCESCQPRLGPVVPAPRPEIPAGPVPQSLPQM